MIYAFIAGIGTGLILAAIYLTFTDRPLGIRRNR